MCDGFLQKNYHFTFAFDQWNGPKIKRIQPICIDRFSAYYAQV